MSEANAGQRQPGALREGDVIVGDLGDIVGHWWARMPLLVVIAAAAGVDIGTFYQVLANVLNAPDRVVWMVVVGFAVVALTLAHWAGLQARQSLNRRVVIRARATAVLLVGIWLMLGLVAFVIRYRMAQTNSSDTSTLNTPQGPVQSASVDSSSLATEHYTALFFLVLYLATGTVAGIAGYFRPEPAARQIVHAVRQRTRASRRHSRTARKFTRIEQTQEAIECARTRQHDAWNAGQEQCRAAAERLKQEARLLVRRDAAHGAPRNASENPADGPAQGGSHGVSPASASLPNPRRAPSIPSSEHEESAS